MNLLKDCQCCTLFHFIFHRLRKFNFSLNNCCTVRDAFQLKSVQIEFYVTSCSHSLSLFLVPRACLFCDRERTKRKPNKRMKTEKFSGKMKCISNKSDKDKLHINNSSFKGDVQKHRHTTVRRVWLKSTKSFDLKKEFVESFIF